MLWRKCTAFRANDRSGQQASQRVSLVVVACAVILFCTPAALADIELGHTGLTGRHRLADMYDSPGAACDIVLPGRNSLGETWIRVSPPVIFARDRTPGVDEQPVGWRANILVLNERTGIWQTVRQGVTIRTTATDQLASYFNGQGWLVGFPLSHAAYRATVEMFWYDPDAAEQIEGHAIHAVEHYALFFRHDGMTISGRTGSLCQVLPTH
ncbi:MAG: hypothetical protein U0031_21425 [Thermomicrobiales bacterium]